MTRHRALTSLAAATAVTLALFACTSLSGLTNDAVPEGGSPDGDTTSETGTDAGGDGRVDGGLVCPDGLVGCGPICVELATSQENCGGCEHTCGGGSCKAGVCQPVAVRGAISNLTGFTVDATTIYIAHDDKIESCPLAGCTGAPTQIASMNGQGTGPVIEVANAFLYFNSAPAQPTTRPALFRCPVTGCPAAGATMVQGPFFGPIYATTTTGAEVYTVVQDLGLRHNTCDTADCSSSDTIRGTKDDLGALSADDAGVYFTEPNDGGTATDLLRCPPGACPDPTVLVGSAAAFSARVAASHAYNGQVYFLETGTEGFNSGYISSCTPPDCAGGPTPHVGKLAYPSDFQIDASGYYWIAQDNAAIETCPLTGCAGGIRTIAAQQASPSTIRISGAFVYWMTAGGTILRVAK